MTEKIRIVRLDFQSGKYELHQMADEIFGVETACFFDAWTTDMIVSSLEQAVNQVFLAWNQEMICGYLIANFVADETELLRVAVLPDMQNLGIGQLLLDAYVNYAGQTCTRGLLEVRHGNAAAKHLYEKNGYQLFATRKNYYKNPLEDADMYEIVFH